MKRTLALLALTAVVSLPALPGFAENLERGFRSPPPSARPWVYWFWLNGNITSNGITADLEAMRRVGIGGVLIMEVDQGVPVGPVDFMSPAWRALFKHVVAEARRLGLEVNMNNDAGWNGSGGPWIRPEQSMQEITWSETNLAGPRRFEGMLARPDSVANFYRDIAVQAFPATSDFRIPDFEAKAAYQKRRPPKPTGAPASAPAAVEKTRLLDLSSKMGRDGRLVWDVPAGTWTVVRLGHTSTGIENSPAPKTGRGLECDKLSKAGLEANFNGMMGRLIRDNLPRPGPGSAGLVATHIDSWENGSQNWTPNLPQEFQRRRGYDLRPFLPVLTGRAVESGEVSERFLWDFRQTISELVAEYYAGHLQELAHRHGLRLSIEAYGCPADSLLYAGRCDEPMGEFWIGGAALPTCKGMASAAHIYGRRIVGAEAFTADDHERWQHHPATVKALGDQAFCAGINRFVFHRYALQPWDIERDPGMTMGPWGLHYERTETWWDQASAWHEYLARCQFMLRQGLFVADICNLQSEDAPMGLADTRFHRYGYDDCNAEVVLTRMSVKAGRLVLPDGMSYRLLALPPGDRMTPALLRKIQELVRAGATIVGNPPRQSPSLSHYPQCDAEVKRLAGELWAGTDAQPARPGRVFAGVSPEKALRDLGVPPDFSSPARLRYLHRADALADIYFVSNPNAYPVGAPCAFRITGKQPELWWPDSGRIEPAVVFRPLAQRTSVWLSLPPSGSVFVVFRQAQKVKDPVVSASRDGAQIALADERVVPVKIKRATYGPANDPARTRDVTAQVQQLVDAGESTFPVSQLAAGDDPAPGTLKTLTVEFEAEGQPSTVIGRDPDTVRISPHAGKLVVLSARYGVLDDPKRTRDVKFKLQHLLDAGERAFQVARMAEGDDPAFLVVKTLIVEYTQNGQHFWLTNRDPDQLDFSLPPPALAGVVQVRLAGTRNYRLETRQPGSYELKTLSGRVLSCAVPSLPPPQELTGRWRVAFAPARGLSRPPRATAAALPPTTTTFAKLISWSQHEDPAIKYFSGQATYTKTFSLPHDWLRPRQRVGLDLGDVQVMAEIKLNGKLLGRLWKPPFELDITGAARSGDNHLEITVVNLWPNRLIGDEQLPEDSDRNPDGTLKRWPQWLLDGKPSPSGRSTFTTWRLWKKNDAPLPSGLIGPVKIVAMHQPTLRN